jgi:hypothetical protein
MLRIALEDRETPPVLEDFLEHHVGSRPAQLALPLSGAA